MTKIEPIPLLLTFVFLSLIVVFIQTPVTFTEKVNNTTIYFKNTDNITVVYPRTVIVWKNGTGSTIANGKITPFVNTTFTLEVFAYVYGLYDALVPKTPKTYTLNVVPKSYIEGYFPRKVILTAYRNGETIYFVNSSITIELLK